MDAICEDVCLGHPRELPSPFQDTHLLSQSGVNQAHEENLEETQKDMWRTFKIHEERPQNHPLTFSPPLNM